MNKLKYNFTEVSVNVVVHREVNFDLYLTENSFLTNKCVQYCKIILFVFMNKLNYNFIEVSIKFVVHREVNFDLYLTFSI